MSNKFTKTNTLTGQHNTVLNWYQVSLTTVDCHNPTQGICAQPNRKTCNKCGKPNHLAKMCLSGQRTAPAHGHHKQEHGPKQTAPNCRPDINYISTAPEEEKEVEESSSSDKKYIFTLWQEPGKTRVPEINVEINGVERKMTIDTDASTNIMDKGAYQKIKPTQLIKLTEVRCWISAYSLRSRLSVLGNLMPTNGQQVTSTVTGEVRFDNQNKHWFEAYKHLYLLLGASGCILVLHLLAHSDD